MPDLSRIERLNRLLTPLVECSTFTVAEAKTVNQDEDITYVRRIINRLAKDGVLQRKETIDGHESFYWEQKAPCSVSDWIHNYVHADQVTETPVEERPRERLMRDGPDRLTDGDLLAILIRSGIQGESAIVAGRKLANRFTHKLGELRVQSPSEIKLISRAINKMAYAQIMAGIELGRRVTFAESAARRRAQPIRSTSDAVAYCLQEFATLARDSSQEEFHIVSLDTKNKPSHKHRITVGTLDASLVHPREVFRPAIRDAASSVILVHNHPSGDPTPSSEDLRVTDRLTEVGKIIGIDVLDHIVVGYEQAISIREYR